MMSQNSSGLLSLNTLSFNNLMVIYCQEFLLYSNRSYLGQKAKYQSTCQFFKGVQNKTNQNKTTKTTKGLDIAS